MICEATGGTAPQLLYVTDDPYFRAAGECDATGAVCMYSIQLAAVALQRTGRNPKLSFQSEQSEWELNTLGR